MVGVGREGEEGEREGGSRACFMMGLYERKRRGRCQTIDIIETEKYREMGRAGGSEEKQQQQLLLFPLLFLLPQQQEEEEEKEQLLLLMLLLLLLLFLTWLPTQVARRASVPRVVEEEGVSRSRPTCQPLQRIYDVRLFENSNAQDGKLSLVNEEHGLAHEERHSLFSPSLPPSLPPLSLLSSSLPFLYCTFPSFFWFLTRVGISFPEPGSSVKVLIFSWTKP